MIDYLIRVLRLRLIGNLTENKGKNMLILVRKIHESIMIGQNIRIEIVDMDQTSVRLGVEAPRIIPVHRQEVYQRIQRGKIVKQNVPGHLYHKHPFNHVSFI